MFDNLIRELRRLEQQKSVSVPIEADADGYLDRECPAPECLFLFKVHEDDWSNIVRDEEIFCPSCRHAAPSRSWYTTAQAEEAPKYALAQLQNRINNAMRADAAASKQRQKRNSFINITLDVKGGRKVVSLPVAAADPMRLRTACEDCGCRYSYIGAAYFCPSCGSNSASHTFSQTLVSIRTAAALGPTLRASMDADEAEVITRSLLEKAMQDTVTSFQRLCEQLFEQRNGSPARRNAFQRLDHGSDLWRAEFGVGYDDLMSEAELVMLRRYFQQRHLLSHQQGIVDQDYITRSGDTHYREGQRLIIRDKAVDEFADLIEKLGSELIARCKA